MSITGSEKPSLNKTFAPWNAAEVAALNDYQERGEFHPFTCGAGQRGEHVGGIALVATETGWRCPVRRCSYTQDWAWIFMTQPADDTYADAAKEEPQP